MVIDCLDLPTLSLNLLVIMGFSLFQLEMLRYALSGRSIFRLEERRFTVRGLVAAFMIDYSPR